LPVATLEPIAQDVAEAIEKEVGEFPSETPSRRSEDRGRRNTPPPREEVHSTTSLAHGIRC